VHLGTQELPPILVPDGGRLLVLFLHEHVVLPRVIGDIELLEDVLRVKELGIDPCILEALADL
jgi:hypothetical protein